MKTYVEKPSCIVLIEDKAQHVFPKDIDNSFYKEYLQWLAAGNQPTVEPEPTKPDLSDIDNIEKTLKAILLTTGRWQGKTVAQIKADFKTAWQDVNKQ